MLISEIQEQVHQTAVAHGWWEGTTQENCPVAEKIALMHSELSEALEEWRSPTQMPDFYNIDGKPEGIAVELADCIIRILDLAGFMEWDIEKALKLKMEYNETRPYRHGNKRI
jgi:NTP pyrophosphatase (non-canonical NTP hydrolase)